MDTEEFKEWCEWGVRDGEINHAGGKVICDTPQGEVKFDARHNMISVRGVASRTHKANHVDLRSDSVVFEGITTEIETIGI